MKYVLLLMGNLADERCGETEEGPGVEDFIAFDAELEKAGVLAGGFGLTDPEEGTSVTRADAEAEAVITAGPYAESREFVGGTIVLDVPSLDEALAWAAKCPGAIGGRVEVRPMLEL
ncbi:YciI family protein [Brachybacterium paraconglomeratum]|uniref:YciI family protein n=1 Tax=Brachybacterium TaxID=43668 RepID=UPI00293B57F1|nr:YciI family protein [Brachybacterium paraconglomeratum]